VGCGYSGAKFRDRYAGRSNDVDARGLATVASRLHVKKANLKPCAWEFLQIMCYTRTHHRDSRFSSALFQLETSIGFE